MRCSTDNRSAPNRIGVHIYLPYRNHRAALSKPLSEPSGGVHVIQPRRRLVGPPRRCSVVRDPFTYYQVVISPALISKGLQQQQLSTFPRQTYSLWGIRLSSIIISVPRKFLGHLHSPHSSRTAEQIKHISPARAFMSLVEKEAEAGVSVEHTLIFQ